VTRLTASLFVYELSSKPLSGRLSGVVDNLPVDTV